MNGRFERLVTIDVIFFLFIFFFQLLRSTNFGLGSFASSDLHQEDEMSAASYGLHAYTVRYNVVLQY